MKAYMHSITRPLIAMLNAYRFLLNAFATRQSLRRVMDDIGMAIQGVCVQGVLQEDGYLALRSIVLNRCPAWSDQIKQWERKTGNVEMERPIYLEATSQTNAPFVAAYWMASPPHIMAPFNRNLDAGCSDVGVLENAPVNTDFVEGNMGVVDHLRHISQVHMKIHLARPVAPAVAQFLFVNRPILKIHLAWPVAPECSCLVLQSKLWIARNSA